MATLVLNNIIYLHIPKTAGSSIADWVNRSVNGECKRVHKDHPLLARVLTEIDDEKYFVFTSVRNPWARTFSGYQNLLRHFEKGRQDMMKHHMAEIIEMNGEVPDFNRWVELLPHTTSMVGIDWSMTTPQTEWVKPGVNLVLKVENLDTEFKQIQDMFDNREPLGLLNKSKLTLDYQAVYSDASKKIVSKLFESDIDTWKYSY